MANTEFEELEGLSPKEREYVLKILNEIGNTGQSKVLQDIKTEDYEEVPVDIHTFLHDMRYLGKGLTDDEGRFTLFPYWEKLLEEIYADPLDKAKYNTLALTGGIGLGKSTVAVIIGCYELYRMLCLKDPYIHYGLQPIDMISFVVINITKDAAKGVAWSKMQALLQSSSWFMSKGTLSKGDNPDWKPPKGIELIYGSLPRHYIGRAVYWAFMDEVSFQPNQDVEKQKEKAKLLVSTATARMQSRFMRGDYNPTILCLASSKRTEQSYMETFIEEKRKNESKTTKVVDEPQWIIRTDKDSQKKFKVAIGNKFQNSEVLPLDVTEADLKIYRDRGFQLLDVPMGYYENFIDDIDIALTDIAGISTSNTTRYIAGTRIAAIKKPEMKNLFMKDVIEVGNGKDDTAQYYDFINMENLNRKMLDRPMFIHLDMSISGDKTGIAGVWIKGKKPHQEGQPESKDLFYTLAFSVSIKAPKGHQISFEKNRQFIRWLREQGFAIKGISSDTFQSADLLQVLQAENFNTEVISVDRVKDNICIPYQTLKSAIYEERLEMYEAPLLTEELIGLERNNNGKVDHSPSGINCFTGDTNISLVDGRVLSIKELMDEYNEGKTNYVYSFNEITKKIEPKPIVNAFISGVSDKLVEVTLDNGEKIRCTPEHRFMLRDGTYCEAQNLIPFDSLMPLYTRVSDKGLVGYRMYYEPIEDAWHYEHRQFVTEVLNEKYLVHHKDCNKLNNNPNNLIWMSKGEHTRIHSKEGTGAYSKQATLKRSNSVKQYHDSNKCTLEYWTRYHKDMTPEEAYQYHLDYEKSIQDRKNKKLEKHLHNQHKKELQLLNQAEMAKYYNIDLDKLEGTELQSLMIKYARVKDPTYQERVSQAISNNHKLGKYKNSKIALQNFNNETKQLKELCPTIDENKFYEIFGISWDGLTSSQKGVYSNKYRRIVCKDILNHKVVSIKFIDTTETVYDLTIKDNHNFALASGIFVHNSKDQADGLCGALYNASQHAEEFAFEFGEDLETLINVSNASDSMDRQQITVSFEEELMKAFDVMSKDKEKIDKKDQQQFMDFGMGRATSNFNPMYLSNGIVI